MINIQEIVLDVAHENSFKILHAKQYDENSRFLKITVAQNGAPIHVGAGHTVVMSIVRADKEEKTIEGRLGREDDVDNYPTSAGVFDGTVVVPFPNWMLQVDGKCFCEVSIVKDGAKLTTLTFTVLVEKALYKNQNITDDQNYDILVSLITQAQDIIARVEGVEAGIEDAKNAAAQAVKSAEEASEALLNAQEQIESAQALADKAERSASDAQRYAQEAKNIAEDFQGTIDEVAEARGEYESLDERITAMQTEIEGGVPKDIAVIQEEDGTEKMVLVDAEGNQLGEGTELPDSGAMGLESAVVTVGDAEMVEVWLKDKNGEKIEGSETRFAAGSGGGGGTASTTITIERITTSPLIITPTDSALIEFNFSSVDSEGQSYDGYYTWKIGSRVLSSGTLNQGYNSFDMTEFVTVGTTTKFSLSVQDDAGSVLTRVWNVQVVDIRIESSFDDKRTYTAGESIRFGYVAHGAVDKTVHFKLDGEEIGTFATAASGSSQTFTIPGQTHGAHLFEVYITATINGKDIETDHIYRDIIWYDETSDVPIIGCIYRKDHYGLITLKQLNTKTIPFYVVDPSTGTPTITKEVDGTVVSTETLSGSSASWAFKTSEIGEHTLIIRCGETYVEIGVNTTDIGFNVDTVGGYAFDFSPSGRSNNSTNRLWEEESDSSIKMTVSDNFDWQNGGYQIDENGNEYFCVKTGTRAYISYKLFAKDAKQDGSAFKIIFKATNVGKADATFLSCETGSATDKAGFKMNVHEAYITTSGDSLYVPYSEEDIIEFEYNINPIDTTVEDATSYIMSYEDGVALRPLLYDDSHVLKQYDPADITIGSDYCDVHIYRMRAYENSLTDVDILSNFVTDARNSDEMISRHDRNEIYAEGGILTPEVLAEKCPDLRIIKIEAPWFTNDKDNKIDGTTVQMIYKNGDAKLDNWTCTGARHSGQGTSSNEYGYAGRNLDLIMDGDTSEFTLGDGSKTKTITLTRTSVPTDYLNVKVNIASSENQNNAQMAQRYNQFNPYQRTAKKNNPFVKDCMEFYNCVVFIRETDEDITTHREFKDTNWHFYAFGNVGDSKKTDDTRVDDKNDPKECVLEIVDYNVALAEFPTGDGEFVAGNKAYDDLYAPYKYKEGKFKSFGNESYEFRYEKKGITEEQRQANIDAWRAFYTFVVTSTDEEFYANLKDYFVVDSALYYYLFTERYTMVDNRAKNSFWHYGKCEDGVYRWDLTFGYDFDTSLGIDNTGKLVLPYGKEDSDFYVDGDPSSSYIYRAAESTFFTKLKRLFATELQAMFVDRESANAWSASGLITQWDTMQAQFPEELWRLDMERKYLRTYKGVSIDNSIQGAVNPRFFRDMMNGRKKYQRRQFERNQEIYFATKYFGNTAKSDQIMMRFNNPIGATVAQDYTLYLTPYVDMYLGVSFANGATPKHIRAKAGVEYEIEHDGGSADITLIYGASCIQKIGDLSKCYVGDNDFSKATRLQELVIGSDVEGYENTYMTQINLGNNKLLEYLDIRNISGLNTNVNLSQCQNLTEIYAEGSNISGVTFAKNGKLETAHLPNTVSSLIMQNLQCITDFQMSYDNLTVLTIENSLIDEKAVVLEAIDTLRELRLVGVDWTGEKSLANTSLLNDIFNLSESELIGRAYVSGQIRTQELANYESAWLDFTVEYDPAQLVEQYLVTYVDSEGKKLYECYVDRGSYAPDPVETGAISTPTKASTPQYTYTFSEWDNIDSVVLANRTVTALFDATVRTYKVKWYASLGGNLLEEQTVEYGSEAVFSGETPTNTTQENVYIYNVFAGWDKSTGCVRENINVYPVWETASLPEPKAKDLSEMTTGEVYAIATAAASNLADVSEYFEDKDYHDITMGTDFNFSNVDSEEIVPLSAPVVLDGETAIDTDVYLFGSKEKTFTMAIDFTFACDSTDVNNTLLAAFEEDGSEGFRLRYNSYPSIQWGDKSQIVGNYTSNTHYRDIVVIRHIKGEDKLYIYSGCQPTNSNGARFATSIEPYVLTRTRATSTEMPITLGAIRFQDGGHDYYGKGVIHWCKVWYDDLGVTNSKELATWCRETLRMEYCGTDRYRLAGGSSVKAKASFVANNLLSGRGFWMNSTNTNAGGWDESLMRDFCNGRLFDALPTAWRSMIKKVKINATAGSQSSEITISEDKVYLISCTESGGQTGSPYNNEGSQISWFTSNANRIKFKGRIRTDESTVFSAATDPSATPTNNVKAGDVWINTGNQSIGYIYVTQEELDTYNLTPAYTAAIGGGWISAAGWWERSPYVANSTYFWDVTANGNVASGSASIVFGVCPCFSI